MRKSVYLLLSNSEKIIHNNNIPACINCVHYKSTIFKTKLYSRCNKFGVRDVITNKIYNDFADLCRNNESKCGVNGKHFEEERNKNKCKNKLLYNLPNGVILLNTFLAILNCYTLHSKF